MKRIREKESGVRWIVALACCALLADGRVTWAQEVELGDLVLPAAQIADDAPPADPGAEALPADEIPVADDAPEAQAGGVPDVQAEAEAPIQLETVMVLRATETSGHVTLDLVEVEIGDAVKLVAKLAGASIISATTNMNRRVSATIVDKPWKPALEMLLEQCDLRLSESREGSGIYVIGPRVPGEREPWITEAFQLSYLKSREAAELLKSLLGAADAKERVARPTAAAGRKVGEDIKDDVQVVFREDGRVVSYPAGNMVVVSATANKLEEVRLVLKAIDQPRPQVYIEAKIIELTGGDSSKIGIDWSMLDGYGAGVGNIGRTYQKTTTREKGSSEYQVGEGGALYDHRGKLMSLESSREMELSSDPARAAALNPSTIAQANTGTPYAGVESATPGGAAVVGFNEMAARFTSVTDIRTAVFGADVLQVVLSALQQSDNSSVISNPKIIVANEEKAMIDMSRKEPYIEVSRRIDGTGVNLSETITTEMKVIPGRNDQLSYIEEAFFTYGIKVDVTPRINNASNITVTIEPTISEVLRYNSPGAGLTQYPVIDTKRVRTVFSMSNGQTAVIGGLTTTSERDVVKKIPLLGDIPLIGTYLFSHASKQKVQRETIIFVTVGIVGSGDERNTMSVPEGAHLVHGHVTPEGRLIAAEAARAAQKRKLRDLEQAAMMEPLGDEEY